MNPDAVQENTQYIPWQAQKKNLLSIFILFFFLVYVEPCTGNHQHIEMRICIPQIGVTSFREAKEMPRRCLSPVGEGEKAKVS